MATSAAKRRRIAHEDPGYPLAKLSMVKRDLMRIASFGEACDVIGRANALRVFFKAQSESFDAQQAAAEVCVRAKRHAGRIIADTEKKKNRHSSACTLQELGITAINSHRWQAIASVDEPIFEQYLEHAKESGREITSVGAYKLARKDSNHTDAPDPVSHGIVPSLNDLIDLGAKFSTVYADPPWQYSNTVTRANVAGEYKSTMSVDEICAEPVPAILADDAHLHLWTTNSFLFDAKRVLDAWGFTYKSCFVWVKPQMGIGNYWRVSHEFMLLGVRGKLRFADRGQKSWLESDRTKHSQKPAKVRQTIEKVSPGPYLEMYGREALKAPWTVYGNEVVNRMTLDGFD